MFNAEIYTIKAQIQELTKLYFRDDSCHLSDSVEHNEYLFNKCVIQLSHNNLVRYFSMCKSSNYLAFVNEGYDSSLYRPLDEVIDKCITSKLRLSEEQTKSIIFQILSACIYLQENKIPFHCILPQNILFNSKTNHILIKSYFMSKLFKQEQTLNFTDLRFLSPEVVFNEKLQGCEAKSVAWSVAIILLNLLASSEMFAHSDLYFSYIGNEKFAEDYYGILLKYRGTNIFFKKDDVSEEDKSTKSCLRLLELFMNGKFIDRSKLINLNLWNDFLYSALHFSEEKRAAVSELIQHSLFFDVRNKFSIAELYVVPHSIEDDCNINELNKNKVLKIKQVYSELCWNIFTNIYGIDLFDFLFKQKIIEYYSALEILPDIIMLDEVSKSNEEAISIDSPKIYFVKEYTVDLKLNFKMYEHCNEGIKGKLLAFSQLTKSIDDTVELSISEYSILGSASEFKSRNEIKSLVIKSILLYDLYQKLKQKTIKLNEFQQEFRQHKLIILPFLRNFTYLSMLDVLHLSYVDLLFPDSESLIQEFSKVDCNDPKLKEFIQEYDQIKKDVLRSKEYHPLINSKVGQQMMLKLFEGLLLQEEDFFYFQGMEAIAAASLVLFYPSIVDARNVMMKIVKKLSYVFLDSVNKTITSLNFFHLIVSRLLAYFDPELYEYLIFQLNLFEEPHLSSWVITLFSRCFSYNDVFLIWDCFFYEKINFIYLVTTSLLLHIRSSLLGSDKDFILHDIFPNIHLYANVETVVFKSKELLQMTPQSFLLLSSEFNPEILEELKKNQFYADRWWMFQNYDITEYFVPIIYMEDISLFFERISFLDIRPYQEYNLKKLSNSINLNLPEVGEPNKRQLSSIETLKKSEKIIVVIGNKQTSYRELSILVNKYKVRYVCLLQGGIDIIITEHPDLLSK